MSAHGTPLVAIAAVVGIALVAVPVIGAVGSIAPASDGAGAVQANGTDNATTDTASLGTRISSFMQASTVEADSSVEAGMWAAEYNRTDSGERPAVVESRIDRLERRSERLRDRMSRLQSRHENGTVPRVAYRAQASRLTAELGALDESINETSDKAQSVGVNTSQLDRLKTEVRNLSGQEVAAVAQDLGVGRPDHAGPPDDVSSSRNTTGDDQPGPPDDRGRSSDRPATDADDSSAVGDSTGNRDPNNSERDGSGTDGSEGGVGTDGAGDTAERAADDGGGTEDDADDTPGRGSSENDESDGGQNGRFGGGNGGGPPGRS
jgi:hypothetical protein